MGSKDKSCELVGWLVGWMGGVGGCYCGLHSIVTGQLEEEGWGVR